MTDILLTHSNHLYFDRKQVRKMQPYPPLQTLHLAACLRRDGFDIALFDSTFDAPEEGFREALRRHQPRLVAICEDNFNYLTKMCLIEQRELAFSMCRAAGGAAVPAVVNGSDSTDNVDAYLDAGAAAVMIGEVENTLRETARLLLHGGADSLANVPGLAYRQGSESRTNFTSPRAVMDDLDQLPPPAWDLVAIDEYRRRWREAHGYFSLNMVSSRGCPYRCNWCAKPIYGETYHFRSPEAVAEEMLYLKTSFQPEQIWFADDIFALSGQWTHEFARAVGGLDARIPFKMQSRCDLMTRGTVAALRQAGCEEVWMGAESGSQKVLDAMDKDVRVSEIHQARANLARHGIRACYFLQFGYPGEQWEDIQRTIQLVRETRPDDIGVSVAYPLPGTPFHERVAEQLGSKRNWSDSDDLAMMFQGTYSTEFYRSLRDALHCEVDGFNGRRPHGNGQQRLEDLWNRVEQLERTCANPNPTVLWNSC